MHDIVFVGHICHDRIVPFGGAEHFQTGSAVLCGAMAAARTGRSIAAVMKMAPGDDGILAPMRESGVECHIVPAAVTTRMEVIHPTADVDVRQMFQRASAGFFLAGELPPLATRHLHLAGITDQEFTLDFIRACKNGHYTISTDMQSFVRQVDPATKEIFFRDVPAKKQIVELMDKLKLDIVEARLLTGTDDLQEAAVMIEGWGCPEVVITQGAGVLARARGRTFYEKFSNSNSTGRTGRGDTTFAGYLSWRQDHDVAESLKFAAALVSIKMEKPGPFTGTVQDVLQRVREKHSA
jgi:sugar/nucleoside kinase (ribokinase family)